ncbi:MAG: hypothetical protein ACTH6R_00745 [Pseudoalteromonas nigrifaciens]|uniref:hypothetical protein n=1 Tax=Pseudoalteromonas nigrifaciens TaxID=28109 RepID=UPI003F962A65
MDTQTRNGLNAINGLSSEELQAFIRGRLYKFDGRESTKLRFEMSGYESNKGECTVHNINILNLFADLGIYDFTEYLFLDFYKGIGTIYLKYWGDIQSHEVEVSGYTTSGIILKILELTTLSGKSTRRRA